MPILKREDGVNFVLQPYRETLSIKNASLLRKEVRYLADQYGQNVRLFKRKGGDYEAVFSRETGVLLGESIWHYFNQPDELIYCEMRNHMQEPHILLVVIREGKVYLDTRLTPEAFEEELSTLLVEATGRYAVHTYGNLPDVFNHPAVKAVTPLGKSLFNELAVDPAFQLRYVDAALDEHGLGIKRRSSLIGITVLCLFVLSALWWYAHSREVPIQQQINPYDQYETALQTPAPGRQINAFLSSIQKIDALRNWGWSTDSFVYDGQTLKAPLHSLGGITADLLREAKQLDMTVNLSSSGASLTVTTPLQMRPKPEKIASTQQILGLLIDRMMQILPGKSVQIKNTTQYRVFNQTGVTITFDQVSPEVLKLIALNLDDLPVSLTAITAERTEGLFSGNIELNVAGN